MDIGLDKREKQINKWKHFSLLQISRNSMNICAELMKKYVNQVFPFLNFFVHIFLFFFIFIFICLFIYFGRRDFFRSFISWITSKVTTGNGLKVACFNVLLFFLPQSVFVKFWRETSMPLHFNLTKVIWDLLTVKEFIIYHNCFQIPQFWVNFPDNNYCLV